MLAGASLTGLEGYSPPYLDSAGVLTDCYGNTKNVSRGTVRTKAECENLLETETYRIAVKILDNVKGDVPTITLASFVSFAYNVGDHAFLTSTLLRKWNAGDHQGACQEMHRWVYITVMGAKVKLPGLVNRRKTEYAQCVEGLAS